MKFVDHPTSLNNNCTIDTNTQSVNVRLLKSDPFIDRGVNLYPGVGGEGGGGTGHHTDRVGGPGPRGPPCHQDDHVAAVDVSDTPRHRYPVVKASIHIICPHLIF